jgi:hypothetical protein
LHTICRYAHTKCCNRAAKVGYSEAWLKKPTTSPNAILTPCGEERKIIPGTDNPRGVHCDMCLFQWAARQHSTMKSQPLMDSFVKNAKVRIEAARDALSVDLQLSHPNTSKCLNTLRATRCHLLCTFQHDFTDHNSLCIFTRHAYACMHARTHAYAHHDCIHTTCILTGAWQDPAERSRRAEDCEQFCTRGGSISIEHRRFFTAQLVSVEHTAVRSCQPFRDAGSGTSSHSVCTVPQRDASWGKTAAEPSR